MSYNYAAEGYEEPLFVWEGNWNKRYIKLFLWRKLDPHNHGIWKYVLDVRNRYNETLTLRKDEINHLMAEVMYLVISGEAVEEKKVPKINRFSSLFGDNK